METDFDFLLQVFDRFGTFGILVYIVAKFAPILPDIHNYISYQKESLKDLKDIIKQMDTRISYLEEVCLTMPKSTTDDH